MKNPILSARAIKARAVGGQDRSARLTSSFRQALKLSASYYLEHDHLTYAYCQYLLATDIRTVDSSFWDFLSHRCPHKANIDFRIDLVCLKVLSRLVAAHNPGRFDLVLSVENVVLLYLGVCSRKGANVVVRINAYGLLHTLASLGCSWADDLIAEHHPGINTVNLCELSLAEIAEKFG